MYMGCAKMIDIVAVSQDWHGNRDNFILTKKQAIWS